MINSDIVTEFVILAMPKGKENFERGTKVRGIAQGFKGLGTLQEYRDS